MSLGKRILMTGVFVAFLVAACFLIPSGGLTERAFDDEAQPIALTVYGSIVAGSVLLSFIMACFTSRVVCADVTIWETLSLFSGAAIFALLGARIVYCLVRLPEIIAELGFSFIPRLYAGGYSLVGAVLGGIGGGLLSLRLTRSRLSFRELCTWLFPSILLVLSMCRFGEYFTFEQGLGDYLMDENLYFFPLAIDCGWDYRVPVFFYEGTVALILCIVALVMQCRRKPMRPAICFALISAMQIILESLREDDSLRFGFVRFNQLCAAVALLVILAVVLQRRHAISSKRIGSFAIMLGLLACCTGVEFALDKTSINNILLYLLMALLLSAACWLVIHHDHADVSYEDHSGTAVR